MLNGVPAMRRPMLLAVLAIAWLGACSQHHEPPIGAAPAERAPPLTASAASGPPLFVGRWAASKSACAARGWQLTAGSLISPSALSCQFSKAEPTSAGYTVYSICAVGKASQPTRLIFTFSGSAANRALTLSGGPFTEPVALSRCPAGVESADSTPPASSSAPA
jgi:hypothetical protein